MNKTTKFILGIGALGGAIALIANAKNASAAPLPGQGTLKILLSQSNVLVVIENAVGETMLSGGINSGYTMPLVPGIYAWIASKSGFVSESDSFVISEGEIYELNIIMEVDPTPPPPPPPHVHSPTLTFAIRGMNPPDPWLISINNNAWIVTGRTYDATPGTWSWSANVLGYPSSWHGDKFTIATGEEALITLDFYSGNYVMQITGADGVIRIIPNTIYLPPPYWYAKVLRAELDTSNILHLQIEADLATASRVEVQGLSSRYTAWDMPAGKSANWYLTGVPDRGIGNYRITNYIYGKFLEYQDITIISGPGMPGSYY